MSLTVLSTDFLAVQLISGYLIQELKERNKGRFDNKLNTV